MTRTKIAALAALSRATSGYMAEEPGGSKLVRSIAGDPAPKEGSG